MTLTISPWRGFKNISRYSQQIVSHFQFYMCIWGAVTKFNQVNFDLHCTAISCFKLTINKCMFCICPLLCSTKFNHMYYWTGTRPYYPQPKKGQNKLSSRIHFATISIFSKKGKSRYKSVQYAPWITCVGMCFHCTTFIFWIINIQAHSIIRSNTFTNIFWYHTRNYCQIGFAKKLSSSLWYANYYWKTHWTMASMHRKFDHITIIGKCNILKFGYDN